MLNSYLLCLRMIGLVFSMSLILSCSVYESEERARFEEDYGTGRIELNTQGQQSQLSLASSSQEDGLISSVYSPLHETKDKNDSLYFCEAVSFEKYSSDFYKFEVVNYSEEENWVEVCYENE